MAVRLTWPLYTRLDGNGKPINGAQLFSYEAGTTKKLPTYSDEALQNANSNPIVADGNGEFGDIWLQQQDYKLILTSATDTDPPSGGRTFDPNQGNPAVSGDDFKASPQSPPDMTVLVGIGTLYDVVSKTIVVKTAQTSALIVAPSSDPRIDIIHIDRLTGVIGIDTGSENPSPVDPTISDDKLPIARITLATSTITITDAEITDIRELNLLGSGDMVRFNRSDIQGQTFTAFDDTGSADAYVITPVPAFTAYTKYQAVWVDIANANTSSSTLNASALGNRNVFDFRTGAALIGGEILAGLNLFVDDGTQWILMTPAQSVTLIQIIDRDLTENDIVNTAAETTLYTFTIPAATLGTTGILRVSIKGDYFNNSGSSRTLQLKVKYGSTTLWDETSGVIGVNANRRAFTFDFLLAAINSTSAQLANGIFALSTGGAANTGIGAMAGFSTVDVAFQGTSAEDSTGALALDVTVTHPVADASLSMRAKIMAIELL